VAICRGAAAACVVLLSFVAERWESYWSGCIKVGIVICQQIFSILVLVLFLLQFLLKKLQNRTFFALALATGSGFGAAISAVIVYERASLCKNYFV